MFRDEKEAARARVRALETELERARAALGALEQGVRPAHPADSPRHAARVTVILLLSIAAVVMATSAAKHLVKGAMRQTATLTWRGRVEEPGSPHIPAGTECRLDARVSYVGETTAEPWRVKIRCGGQTVFERREACCSNIAESRCHLRQQTQGGAATYAARCDDNGLWIETDASLIALPNRMKVRIDRWSTPTKRRLFERDRDVVFVREDGSESPP